jgi:hypothetical protein
MADQIADRQKEIEIAKKTQSCMSRLVHAIFLLFYGMNPNNGTFLFFQMFPSFTEDFHYLLCRKWTTLFRENIGTYPFDEEEIAYINIASGKDEVLKVEPKFLQIQTCYLKPLLRWVLQDFFPIGTDGFQLPGEVWIDGVLQDIDSHFYTQKSYGLDRVFVVGDGRLVHHGTKIKFTYMSITCEETGHGGGHFSLEVDGENVSNTFPRSSNIVSRRSSMGVSGSRPSEEEEIEMAIALSIASKEEEVRKQIETDAAYARRLGLQEAQLETDAAFALRFVGM